MNKYLKPKRWKPLEKVKDTTTNPQLILDIMKFARCDYDQALKLLAMESEGTEYWINDVYQVQVTRTERLVHMNIRRRDGAAILRDWRHFQHIKNQLLGPECEAVELYPAESRKVDTSNKYHLWGINDPTFRFPFGYQNRNVSNSGGSVTGTAQRNDQQERQVSENNNTNDGTTGRQEERSGAENS